MFGRKEPSNMPRNRRSYYDSAGANSNLLLKLIMSGGSSGEDTFGQNVPNESYKTEGDVPYTYAGDPSDKVGPGAVPHQYRGNPEDVVGKGGYVTKYQDLLHRGGQFTGNQYADKRGFMERFKGEPNVAQDLNVNKIEAEQEQKFALERAKASGEIQLQNALEMKRKGNEIDYSNRFNAADIAAAEAIAKRTGLPHESLVQLMPLVKDEVKQKLLSEASSSQKVDVGNKQAITQLQATEKPALNTAINTANIKENESSRALGFLKEPANQGLLTGEEAAKHYGPVLDTIKRSDINVGTGDTIFRGSTGIPSIDALFTPADYFGNVVTDVNKPMSLGGRVMVGKDGQPFIIPQKELIPAHKGATKKVDPDRARALAEAEDYLSTDAAPGKPKNRLPAKTPTPDVKPFNPPRSNRAMAEDQSLKEEGLIEFYLRKLKEVTGDVKDYYKR